MKIKANFYNIVNLRERMRLFLALSLYSNATPGPLVNTSS